MPHQPQKIRRRAFLGSCTAALSAGCGVWSQTAPAASTSPNQKLNIAAIGVGNRGVVNITASLTENIVALCDVDQRYLDEMFRRIPEAETYHDFREALDRTDLDAVIISTPDHTHFHPALKAVRNGLHVYIEKPLAHSVVECRTLAQAAADHAVVTQMGNQHHSSAGYRRAAEIVQSGVLGEVRELHSWTTRPLWPQGIERPQPPMTAPDHLHWDLWLGPAPERPYHETYHPINWRGYWDFGVGALGDMGPHLIDPAFWSLKLDLPTKIEATCSPVNDETAPEWSIVKYEFPARGDLPPVTLNWYDGGKVPPAETTGSRRPPSNGTLIIGERGKLFAPERGGKPLMIPRNKGDKISLPLETTIGSKSHQAEWLAACKGEGETSSPFSYAARLTEVCLLGNIAIRSGQRVHCQGDGVTLGDGSSADQYMSRPYRAGWEV